MLKSGYGAPNEGFLNIMVWWKCGNATLYQEKDVAAQALRVGMSYTR
jgi:hypothetical protein